MLSFVVGACIGAFTVLVAEDAKAQTRPYDLENEPVASPADAALLEQRAEQAMAVIAGQKPAADVFARGFLAAVPEVELHTLNTTLEAQYGRFLGVSAVEPSEPYAASITLRYERGTGKGQMRLAPQSPHKITGLLLNDFTVANDSPAKITSDLKALPGEISVLYAPLDARQKPIIAINTHRQMAVGSAFKLYVLSALAREVEAGRLQWKDVVPLSVKSFPSGTMQSWPLGTPVTIETLATMMISVSDNTATDQLMAVVGRDAVEAELLRSGHSAPAKTLPFLTTLELYALKGDDALGDAYANASETAQRRQLAAIDARSQGNPANITPPRFTEPHAIDTIEWFASAEDLRKILARLQASPDPAVRKIMAIAPGTPEPIAERWNYIGFKGGSEPGVLNVSWLLQDKAGAWHVLVISWNNPEAVLDEEALELLAMRIMRLDPTGS